MRVLSRVLRVARKDYSCCICRKKIKRGDQYADCREYQSKGFAFRYCLSCDKAEEGVRKFERKEREHIIDDMERGWDGHKIWLD